MSKQEQIETFLNRYSTVVLSDIQQYGERCAAIAAAESLRSRGVMVSAADVQAAMVDAIVMPCDERYVQLALAEAV